MRHDELLKLFGAPNRLSPGKLKNRPSEIDN